MAGSNAGITIVDCGPRDGLAQVKGQVPTADKIRLINSLTDSGITKVDCVAFTHPRLIPKNSDAEEVMATLKKKPGVSYIGLVPSEIGCRRAIATDIDEILALVAASDAFNRAALGQGTKETLNKTLKTIFEAASKGGKRIRAFVLAAFGCPYSGKVAFDQVIELVSRLSFMGAKEISLLDSTGMAHPKQITEIFGELMGLNLNVNLAVHFHDTRGTGLVNCVAAYEAGVRIFDTAIGGMSGTPFGAPELDMGAWNIPTEDLVHLFEQMGIHTGVDLECLLESVKLAEDLAGRPLPGHILRAGLKTKSARMLEPLKLK